MKLRNKYIFLVLIIVLQLLLPNAYGQNITGNNKTVLSETELTKCINKKPYSSYIELNNNDKPSFSRLQKWLEWFFSKLFGNRVAYSFGNALPYLIIVLALVLIALKITGLSFSQILKPSIKKVGNVGIYNNNDSIQKPDFNKLISIALENNNYRIAIRYSYLLLLQQLNAKGYIKWEKQKSNFDYLFSTQKQTFYKEFYTITQVYENAWYGEIPWTSMEYKNHFNAMMVGVEKINNTIG